MASRSSEQGDLFAAPPAPPRRVHLPGWAAQRVLCGEPLDRVEQEVINDLERRGYVPDGRGKWIRS